MDTEKRLYNSLNSGLFIFVEDEFLFNENEDETKAHVLIDFARMDTEDRKALLDSIPKEVPGKDELLKYAVAADSWIFEIDWASAPQDDAERILEERPDVLALYQAVPKTLWEGAYQKVFLRYGVGVVIHDILRPFFREVIRLSPRYLPTRIYETYTEEIRKFVMCDLETCKAAGKSAVLILDNMVGDDRLAAQMIEDLKSRDVKTSCPIYATVFSTASKDYPTESCETPELYIGYTNKSENLEGVHKNIVRAAINLLIQQYKDKYKAMLSKNCDTLAQNPDLVEYLYSMARAEGEPGYVLLQEWISFMLSHDMEQSDEMVQLVRLSGSLEAYEAKPNWNLEVPKELANAAHSENFLPTVNKFCTAPAPGDIFNFDGKLYILVGQDCDYMMGTSRSRNAPLCELVPAELVEQGNIEKLSDDEKCVYINNFLDSSGNVHVLKVSYGVRKVICNEIINLCSFNQDGYCKINCKGELPEDISTLIQPYMVEYYRKLRDYFREVKDVSVKCPGFYEKASELNVAKPLIDISQYRECGEILDYGIQRISRLKKTASLYLYKMFLEYRGRMPYTTINLTGYSAVTVIIKSAENRYLATMYIKLTNNRNRNRREQTKLTWYISRKILQEAIDEIIGSGYALGTEDDYIELRGKEDTELDCGDHAVTLKKRVEDEKCLIDLELKALAKT